jgi:hypothetical protein
VLGGLVVGGDVVGAPVVGDVGGCVGGSVIVVGAVGGCVGGSVISVVVVLVLVLVLVDDDEVVDELVDDVRCTSIAFVSSPPPLLSAMARPMMARPPTAAPPTIIAARCCRWRSLIGDPTGRTYPRRRPFARRAEVIV